MLCAGIWHHSERMSQRVGGGNRGSKKGTEGEGKERAGRKEVGGWRWEEKKERGTGEDKEQRREGGEEG